MKMKTLLIIAGVVAVGGTIAWYVNKKQKENAVARPKSGFCCP